MNEQERQHFDRLKNDFEYFALNCLKIKSKDKGLIPFDMNKGQRYVHKCIEDHKRKNFGNVRVSILKARQFGISTYIAARMYHKVFFQPGKNYYLICEKDDSTANLFGMVKRYDENIPSWMPRPGITKSNESELVFDTDSWIRTGSAKSSTIARGGTNNYLQTSEMAFFEPNNEIEIKTGLFQTVPAENSEMIFESTANGRSGIFYDYVQKGFSNDEDDKEWHTIFLPWFWHDDYRASNFDDFDITEEEEGLVKLYKLDKGQLLWRRRKISELQGNVELFKQEYPSNSDEAFLNIEGSLLNANLVHRSVGKHLLPGTNVKVGALDPSGGGKDRDVIVLRNGRIIFKVIEIPKILRDMEKCGIVSNLIKKHGLDRFYIDYAYGAALADRLREMGLGHVVRAVQFGMSADDPLMYMNKRAEMYGRFKAWFEQEGGVSIPNNKEFVREVCVLPAMEVVQSSGKLKMIPKEKIKLMNNGKSTDYTDSGVLTFAEDGGILSSISSYEDEDGPMKIKDKSTRIWA
jgi:hypothetical protein